MPTDVTVDPKLAAAILNVMRPSRVYGVHHFARSLSELERSNQDIRRALEALLRDGKVKVATRFMKSATYRLTSGCAVTSGEELAGYSGSLEKRSQLALLARGR